MVQGRWFSNHPSCQWQYSTLYKHHPTNGMVRSLVMDQPEKIWTEHPCTQACRQILLQVSSWRVIAAGPCMEVQCAGQLMEGPCCGTSSWRDHAAGQLMEGHCWRSAYGGAMLQVSSWRATAAGQLMKGHCCRSAHGGIMMRASSWRGIDAGQLMEEQCAGQLIERQGFCSANGGKMTQVKL
jgi:hypothetical protein